MSRSAGGTVFPDSYFDTKAWLLPSAAAKLDWDMPADSLALRIISEASRKYGEELVRRAFTL